MRRASEVHSSIWSRSVVSYDDGTYSAIWGCYDGGKVRTLGLRWDGDPANEADVGFPKTYKHPTWFVVPDEFTGPILYSLLNQALAHESDYCNAIHEACKEFAKQGLK